MGFFQNIAKKAAIKSTKAELERLYVGIIQYDREDSAPMLAVIAEVWPKIDEILSQSGSPAFGELMTVSRNDLIADDELRKEAALMLQPLTALQGKIDGEAVKAAIWFWRVVLMTMMHDELYDQGKRLWNAVENLEAETGERKLSPLKPVYYDS